MKVYGIKNCDTVKKALNWLDNNNLPYEFHDFKKLGISKDKLEEWSKQVEWETLINKKGTTWKKVDLETQKTITSAEAAFGLIQDKTSIIKRPIIEIHDKILVGFDSTAYQNFLLKK